MINDGWTIEDDPNHEYFSTSSSPRQPKDIVFEGEDSKFCWLVNSLNTISYDMTDRRIPKYAGRGVSCYQYMIDHLRDHHLRHIEIRDKFRCKYLQSLSLILVHYFTLFVDMNI